MSLLSKVFNRSSQAVLEKPDSIAARHAAEVQHWNETAQRAHAGERLFWCSHPRVAQHRLNKERIDGVPWRNWLVAQWGGPARVALELGCGSGRMLQAMVADGIAAAGEGVDLGDSRFEVPPSASLKFRAEDINQIELERDRYDFIYSAGSFHHFETLEHIMQQVNAALTDRGFFVLDEFVGPARFQWTDLQLSITAELLALIPRSLRFYANGIEKAAEGRSTPEQVMNVCPSEAIRSDEIVPLFYKYFDVVHDQSLGGTIQHLLYSGIVQNFPDNVPEIDRLIDAIDSLETRMVNAGILPRDFVLLIGRKRR